MFSLRESETPVPHPPYPQAAPAAPSRGQSPPGAGSRSLRIPEQGNREGDLYPHHTAQHCRGIWELPLCSGSNLIFKKCISLPLANIPSSSYHSSGACVVSKGKYKQAYQKLPHHNQCGLLAGTFQGVCGNPIRGNEVTAEIQLTPESGSGYANPFASFLVGADRGGPLLISHPKQLLWLDIARP